MGSTKAKNNYQLVASFLSAEEKELAESDVGNNDTTGGRAFTRTNTTHTSKLLIHGSRVGSICGNRNKIPFISWAAFDKISIPKEISQISSLDEGLYRIFIQDIQASVQFYHDSAPLDYGFMVIFIVLILIDSSSQHQILPSNNPAWYILLFIMAMSINCLWHTSFWNVLQQELHERVAEWQPLFKASGVSVEYVVDKPNWWNLTETYLLFETFEQSRNTVQDNTKENQAAQERSSTVDDNTTAHYQEYRHGDDGAKYMVHFARSFVRRNAMYRVVEVPGNYRSESMAVPRAPSLYNLDVRVFNQVMDDVKEVSGLYSKSKIGKDWIIFAVSSIICIFLFPYYSFAIIMIQYLIISMSYNTILPAMGIYKLSDEKLKEWDQTLNEHGYTISYHIDKPSWWQWYESYVSICPSDNSEVGGRVA